MKTEGPQRRPHIRLLRRRAGLTQDDLATLLGYRSHSQISRFESGRRLPATDELLMLEVIFAVAPGGVFPHLRDRATKTLVARIDKLLARERTVHPISSDPPSRKAVHLARVLESIRCQLAPRQSVHEPWPKVTLVSDTE